MYNVYIKKITFQTRSLDRSQRTLNPYVEAFNI